MRILLITQYFYPEPGAATNRLLSFARGLAKNGHDVTVLCEFPSYPSGILPRQYRFKLFKTEKFENFQIVRSFVLPTTRFGIISRLLNYASYLISSFLVGLFLKRPHVMIASSPPPTVGLSAAALSFLKMVPLIGDIRDLWPEYAIAIGELKSKIGIISGRLTEKAFYWRCFAFITISEGLKEYLEKKTRGKKIFIVMNGSSIPDMPSHAEKRADCFSRNRINVCYAGVVGLLQPIQDIVDAAQMTMKDPSIVYTIIGDGVKRESLENQVLSRNLSNITFTGALPLNETLDILLRSDVAVVPLLNIEHFKSALPSKFFDYMALGLPIILGVDGEARSILEKYSTGTYYKPGCPQDLIARIRWLQAHPDQARAMGQAGKELVSRSYSRSDLAEKMEKIVSDLMRSE
jgi:glycosyltransferase involved in cell wall biosynthesis